MTDQQLADAIRAHVSQLGRTHITTLAGDLGEPEARVRQIIDRMSGQVYLGQISGVVKYCAQDPAAKNEHWLYRGRKFDSEGKALRARDADEDFWGSSVREPVWHIMEVTECSDHSRWPAVAQEPTL